MGTVLWELQSGVERTLEAANLYFQTPERRTTKQKLQGRRFQSFRRKRSLTIIARGPGGATARSIVNRMSAPAATVPAEAV